MNRKHALSISLAVGVAAIAGTVAATKTIHLGHASAQPTAPSAQIVQRTRALDRTDVALRKALKQRPPKLPPLPASAPAATPAAGAPIAATAAPSSQAQRVVYVRPAPIIRHVHRPGGGQEGSDGREADGGSQAGGGGGFDD